LVQFHVTLALTLCKLVQLCTSILDLVCVGINHQKGGDWKGNRVKPFPNWFWWLNCPTQIIGITSLFKIMYSTGTKGSTQTNQKNKLGLKRKKQKGNRRLPWSSALDSPVCHRTMSGAPGCFSSNSSPSDFPGAAPL
jgi:hypothetical protein